MREKRKAVDAAVRNAASCPRKARTNAHAAVGPNEIKEAFLAGDKSPADWATGPILEGFRGSS